MTSSWACSSRPSTATRTPSPASRLTADSDPASSSTAPATQSFGSTYIETEGKLGFQLQAGADYQLGPGAAFLEFRYHFTNVDFVATDNANVGGFLALGAGYRLRL